MNLTSYSGGHNPATIKYSNLLINNKIPKNKEYMKKSQTNQIKPSTSELLNNLKTAKSYSSLLRKNGSEHNIDETRHFPFTSISERLLFLFTAISLISTLLTIQFQAGVEQMHLSM